ncbi:MAG: ribose 5-phosphate isomerase B [Bacteriovoracaceae bacterium]|nr:ribose 5-phosphate isomerase B [Bacteriovoracaceae bacterium]
MKIFMACDHAAFEAKEALKAALAGSFEIQDLGTHSIDSVHYPLYAQSLAKEVLAHPGSKGVLLCGSGIGVSIAANRFKGIRAALCHDVDDAQMSRRHNDANVLCLGSRKTPVETLIKMAQAFLKTDFEGGRHQTRVEMIDQM